jgi:hypothetical protein
MTQKAGISEMLCRDPEQHRNKCGNCLWLTLHRHCEYIQGTSNCVAKFLPRYDSPYEIIDSFPEFSAYTLKLPNSPNIFPTFHVSKLKRFNANDPTLFPSHEHA